MKIKDKTRFGKLFTGLDRAFGIYVLKEDAKKKGDKLLGHARTVLKEVTIDLYEKHLAGEQGLGIVPIMDGNSCLFGAVDIDDYSLEIADIDKFLRKYKIPVIPCRTKSGGIHLYLFCSEPIPAILIQVKLAEIAGAFSLPNAEVFPKQIKLANRESVGNWINLPYFNIDKTDRAAFYKGRDLSFSAFLDLAEKMAVSEEELTSFSIEGEGLVSDGPPCLQQLCKNGFPEGTRNSALFSLGVYCRNKYADSWEDELENLNKLVITPSLGFRELAVIISSIKKKEYYYKCNDQPLNSACNKNLCSNRKYGIGDGGEEIPFILGTLTKIDTDPPTWEMDIDGIRVRFPDTGFLIEQHRFRRLCVDVINKLPPKLKPQTWEKLISDRLDSVEIIEAPADAGSYGQLEILLEQFLSRPAADDKAELLRGKVWFDEDGFAYFRSVDFLDFLAKRNFRDVRKEQLWAHLRGMEAKNGQWNIKGSNVRWWAVSAPGLQDQPFDDVDVDIAPF